MLRRLALALILPASACAAIWPPQLGPHKLVSAAPLELSANRPVWDELGLQAAERADYGQFRVAAYRFKDATGAFAAGQWLSASEPGIATVGNYVLSCAGACPPHRQLAEWFQAGSPPQLSRTSYPSLDQYLPRRNLVSGSKRYVIGPQSLALFEPRIPAEAAAFDFSTEAQIARYRTPEGELTLAIFSYPTPGMARQQAPAFDKLTDAAVKRTGSLVAVVLAAPGQAKADRAAAARLLEQVNYGGLVAAGEAPPPAPLELKPESAGQMILAIISLAGMLLAFCLLSGLAFGGMLIVARKFGYSGADGSLTTLHLSGK